jgi:tripartite-type tricarboxylate transporter receptor subunit TctC
VNSIRELIDYGKKNPGKLSFGTSGAGSSQHLGGVMLNKAAGIDMLHVPYKGGGPALNDLLGGQIPVGIVILSNVLPQAKAGKVKLLAVLEAQRARAAPDTPTVAEAGVAGFAVPDTWVGMVGPARLPPAIVTAMHGALVKALQASDVRSRLEAAGFEVKSGTPEEFAELLTRSFETYRRITSEAGIKPE